MTKTSKKERKTAYRRTLHYYGLVFKKYKLLTAISVIATPIVVLARNTLIPLIFANMIDRVSAGITIEQIIPELLPQAIALLACHIVGSCLLGWLRVYSLWKMELRGMYDLATMCFDAVCTQSMQFH
jgi:ABC-type bacteriocin/lantibiotic exporter with double-glycine peptidase domain